MAQPDPSPDPGHRPIRAPWPLVVLGALMLLLEAGIQLLGILAGSVPAARGAVLEYTAFWPGLLGDWRPNYAFQPVAMFITYGFFHGGLGHFALNMVTLWSFGVQVIERAGPARFMLLYGASLVGGALAFGLLAADPTPMVGASGAIFGLLGAVLAWDYRDRSASARSLWPVARAVGLLAVLNLALWWAMGGLLAWQTHLGGFLAGWAGALWIERRIGSR